MKRKQLKFVVGAMIILMTLTYLGFTGFQESSAYYYTVAELHASEKEFKDKRLKVAGDVVPGSIEREGKSVRFRITKDQQMLNVHYVGTDPLPDTFRDHAEAIVEGKLGNDGVFTAHKMQAKCASKYEKELEAGVITEAQTEK